MGKHAIIVIKNKDNQYLQYYDKRWNSKLFPNCKLDDVDHLTTVTNKVHDILGVSPMSITVRRVGIKTHKKFSESDKMEKEYTHEFYVVSIEEEYNLPEDYCFMTYDDMLNDRRIMECNSDIISFIKEFHL